MGSYDQLNHYQSISEILQHSSNLYPKSNAFSDLYRTITFAELDHLSDCLARYLIVELGMSSGDRIAIQLNNIVQYPIAIYGALKAGLILVNTNPLYTEREIEHQFNDAGVKTLIVLDQLLPIHETIQDRVPVEHIISVSAGLLNAQEPSERGSFNHCLYLGARVDCPLPKSERSDIAFLQYTGGTTGLSKGAMLTHQSILSNVKQTLDAIGSSFKLGEEIMVVPLPMYHTYACAISGLIMPFLGAESVLIPNPRDLNAFVEQLQDKPFSIFAGINTLFVGLTQIPAFKALDFSRLKLTISGGTSLTQSAADAWKNFTDCRVCEAYGMTEASPVISFNEPANPRLGYIGKPIPDTDIKIVPQDEASGSIGELWVKGPQVMQGYWQNPEETNKVITEDGWLKTGDIVTEDNGYLKIVDRKKDMIIVSGFNVYPNEIEDVITQHPSVLECGVIGVPNEKTGEQVTAFIVKRENESESSLTTSLLEHCQQHLTGYKIPKRIQFIEELPKSNVGKILRKDLRTLLS